MKSILIAAGLDDRDLTTLRHAAWFVPILGASQVYLAHIAPTFDLPPGSPAPPIPIDEDIEQRLRAIIDMLPGLFPPALTVRCLARQGQIVPELIRLAAQKSADLLCLARRPKEQLDTLSESALNLVRKAPCSVLVVPAGVEPEFMRIMVPIDFSEHSRDALNYACMIASGTPGAVVTVQHAYEVPIGWHKMGRSFTENAEIVRHLSEQQWEQFQKEIDTRGVPIQTQFVLCEDVPVPGTILATADAIDASLIVMGSHGRTRMASMLLGHVADIVCSRTSRPVLCVKKKGEVVDFLQALLQILEMKSD